MKLCAMIPAALAAACAGGHRPDPLPEDRPATADELAGVVLAVECEDAGGVEVTLSAPRFGEGAAPAEARFDDRWDPEAFPGGEGTWSYDPATGDLHVDLGPLVLDGTATVEHSWEGQDGRRTTSTGVVATTKAEGTWAALGQEGAFQAVAVDATEATAAAVASTSALVVDLDTGEAFAVELRMVVP